MSKTVTLAYEEMGEADGIPLIIMHGFFASGRNWRSIARRLAEHNHIYLLDMRNHGLSPHVAEMDYPAMADDLAVFMHQHHIEQAHLLGHSMGGKAAMWFALQHPDHVAKLIVADISPTVYQHSFDQTVQALKSIPLKTLNNRKQAEEYLQAMIAESDYRQFLLQNLQLIEGEYQWRVDLEIFLAEAPNIVGFPETLPALNYPKQALFLGGEDSDYIRDQDVYRLFPNALIKHIPNAAHWLHVQQPEAFYQAVVEFL